MHGSSLPSRFVVVDIRRCSNRSQFDHCLRSFFSGWFLLGDRASGDLWRCVVFRIRTCADGLMLFTPRARSCDDVVAMQGTKLFSTG